MALSSPWGVPQATKKKSTMEHKHKRIQNRYENMNGRGTERIQNRYGMDNEGIQKGYGRDTDWMKNRNSPEQQQNAFCQALPVRFLLIGTTLKYMILDWGGIRCDFSNDSIFSTKTFALKSLHPR